VRRLTTPVRAAIASLVGVLAITGLSGVASPAAAYTGHALPGVTLERPDALGSGGARTSPDFGVRAEVTKSTALFEVDLIFPLEGAGLDCADPANHNAEFRWELATRPEDVASGASAADVTKVSTLCTSPSDGVLAEIKVSNSVKPFDPNAIVNVMAEVEKPGTSLLAENDPDESKSIPKLNQDEHWVGQIQMPHQPVWVGVGDGYTSAAYQQEDCELGTSAVDCAAAVNGEGLTLDLDFLSWITYATDQVNQTVPAQWAIQPQVVAKMGASGADLRDSGEGSQVKDVLDALTSVQGHGIQPDTWNWIGLSAGLGDSGISDILADWYGSAPERGAVGSPYPWEVGAGADCPSFAAVPGHITGDARGPLQDGILNALASAFSVSENLRVVQLLYPYFVDEASACRAEVVAAVDAMNSVIDTAGLSARLDELGQPQPLQAADLSRVSDMDLNEVFDSVHPTGDPVGTGENAPSDIQLTKPFGYPHLSGDGSQQVGIKAGTLIEEAGPPVVTPTIELVDPADGMGDGFFRGPVRITYSVYDPADPSATFDVPPTILTDEGRYTGLKTPAGICSAQPPNKCAVQVDIDDIKIDSLAPDVEVQYFDAAGQAPVVPSSSAWFKDNVTVEWYGLEGDHAGTALLNDVSGYDDPLRRPVRVDRPRTVISAEGRDIIAMAPDPVCDFAGNCATVDTSVNIDKHAPTITGTATGVPASGWFNAASPNTIGVRWTATDALSGVSGTGTVAGTIDASTSGTFTSAAPPSFTDLAGNTSTGAPITIKVDRVAPQVSLTGGLTASSLGEILDGAEFTASTMPKLFSCATSDAGGSGIKGDCSVALKGSVTLPGGTGTQFTYTVSATDVAGNVTTYDVVFTGAGVVNTVPPTVTGTVSRAPNADGWYNAPVTITWSYAEGSPSAGISTAAKNAFNNVKTTVVSTDGKNMLKSSPVICDVKNQCSTVVKKTISLDQVKPVISITNVTDGARYIKTAPTPGCTGTDALSGFKSCTTTSSWTPLPASGPPGKTYTVTATGTDLAGNVGTKTVTYTLFEVTPSSGRMTGSGKVTGTTTEAEFTLRCNGSPNQLDVDWTTGGWYGWGATSNSFDLDTISQMICWDDSRYSEGSPNAPIDSLWATGTGTLKNGQPATIEFMLTDQGEPGRDRDTLSFVIKDANGNVVLSSTGKLTGGGNVQAHDAQGNGTNDNGHVNGPHGHYDHDGYDGAGYDHDGYDRDGYDHDGYDRDGCDKRGYDRSGRRVKSGHSGYDRNGRDDDGYDRSGYDRSGYNRSGYDRSGYNRSGYDRDGYDRDGCDRNGYDQRGNRRKSGSRR
jgi:hypothetical protein